MRNMTFVLRSVCLAGVLGAVLLLLNHICTPKYYNRDTWPTTSTYIGFYEMPEQSVDVIFLGSSHAAASFIPQVLYDEYGITSYNLGCEQQNMVTSYYWLKEALQYQRPQVVILDTLMLHTYHADEALNSSEACTRKALDQMRWGTNKIQAVHDICSIDTKQSKLSYYLTNIRFHTRWKNLNQSDFSYKELSSNTELKGYAPLLKGWNTEYEYEPFTADESVEAQEMVPVSEEYLNKIVDLCAEYKIRLILVKNVATVETQARYNSVRQYADRHAIRFVDFNERSVYEASGFEFLHDMNRGDSGHLNIYGAQKVTDYLGRILSEEYKLRSEKQKIWSDTSGYFQEVLNQAEFCQSNNLPEYLQQINRDRYSIFVSVKDEASESLTPEIVDRMRALGFQFDMQDAYRNSYIAVKTPEETYEARDKVRLSKKGTVNKGRFPYEIISAGMDAGNISSIKISGKEYSKNSRGLNIVVYDNVTQAVIDNVCFDTYSPELTVKR